MQQPKLASRLQVALLAATLIFTRQWQKVVTNAVSSVETPRSIPVRLDDLQDPQQLHCR